MTPTEQEIEAEIQAKGKTAPRITPKMIDDLIMDEYYLNFGDALELTWDKDPQISPLNVPAHPSVKTLTVCVLVLRNGAYVLGESNCAHPDTFDAEIGRKIARDHARGKIWALEGYRLRSELAAK